MSFIDLKCPNCHKIIPVDAGQEKTYCVYCGEKIFYTEIAGTPITPDDMDAEQWDSLFKAKSYEYIQQVAVRCKERNQNYAEANAFYLLASLKQHLYEYHDYVSKYTKPNTLLSRLFSSKNKDPEDFDYHKKFFNDISQTAYELAKHLEEITEDKPEPCHKAAQMAVETFIIFDRDNNLEKENITYDALEKEAISFFPFLTQQDIKELIAVYKPCRSKRLFGHQVMKALKAQQCK